MKTSSQVRLEFSGSFASGEFSGDFTSGEYLETSPHVNLTQVIMFAPPRGGVHCFCADRRLRWRQRGCLKNYISGTYWWILTKLAWLHCQDGGKESSGFDGLDHIFKGTAPKLSLLGQKWRICSLFTKFGQTWFNISLHFTKDLIRFAQAKLCESDRPYI